MMIITTLSVASIKRPNTDLQFIIAYFSPYHRAIITRRCRPYICPLHKPAPFGLRQKWTESHWNCKVNANIPCACNRLLISGRGHGHSASIYNNQVKVKVKVKDKAPLRESSPQKRAQCSQGISQFYLHTHTFIRNRNEPYMPLPSQL